MQNQIQIDADEAAAEAELAAVKMISARIAEQNATILTALKSLVEQQVAQGENLAAMFGAMVDAIKDINITVRVPDQPAPVVNVSTPKEEKKTYKAVMIRNADGDVVDLQVSEK